MVGYVRKLLELRFVRFAIVGGAVFIIAFVLLAFFVEGLHFNQIAANVATTIFALELNFFLNKRFNWSERVGSLRKQLLKFHAMKGGFIFFNLVVYTVLVSQGAHYLLVTASLTAIETVISFFGNDRFTFREKDV